MTHLSNAKESLVEAILQWTNATCDVAMILLSHRARRRETSRLSRVARASALTPVAAAFARWLATKIAELGAARTLNVMASLRELDGARTVGADLEFGATLVRLDHLLLVLLLGLSSLHATMVDDIRDALELGSAVQATETLAGGVRASFDGDVLFAFTVDDETADELATKAKDAFLWEGGVLDSLELVLLEERRVEMIGVVEDSLVVQLDGILVCVGDDANDGDFQAFEADVTPVADDFRFSLWLGIIADRADVVLRDWCGGRHGCCCCWLFASCCG